MSHPSPCVIVAQLLSRVRVFVTPWTAAHQVLCPPLSSRVCANSCPLSQWCYLTISSPVTPFFACPQSFPGSGSFPVSQLFASGGQSIGASAPALVLPKNIQDWFSLVLTGWISLQSKDSQESSPAPQFESINSWVLSLLYGPTCTSICDYWKNHSFDYTDLCLQSDVCDFKYTVLFCHSFPSKEHVFFNFMAAITVCSDFGAQENKICHCFRFFPFYLLKPFSDPNSNILTFDPTVCWAHRLAFQ